ncbi:thiamine diphosphokinase [Haploplasma axanthum]|uniref:Thiamine diphosphokinase n=1 Tax=Haploplasma axanthum TaxID=29552 RepID=A0A449BFD4_HAPAX|nr:thiamine diphosphokinase [Haploplasma axanthum]VEU81167.1 Thiamine pyrophosphokinase [Haploplasma axanthum]
MKVVVFSNIVPDKVNSLVGIENDDFIIAVDGAFDSLIKQKVRVNLVVGDLDSISDTKLLKKYDVLKLNKEKDDTDTKVAIKEAYKRSKTVILVGGIQGRRIEHFLANINLLDEHNNLMIVDQNSKIYLLEKGKHMINKNGYVSFFAYEDKTIITLEGFKYPLKNYELTKHDSLCISNEVIRLYGEIEISMGRVLVIESKK